MAINKKLIHFNTFENFNSKKLSANVENTKYTLGIDGEIQDGSPDILYLSIVYIKDTQQLWTHGLLHGHAPVIHYSKIDFTSPHSKINFLNNDLNYNIDYGYSEHSLLSSLNYLLNSDSIETNLTNKKLLIGLKKLEDLNYLNTGAILELYEDYSVKQTRLSFKDYNNNEYSGSTIRLDKDFIRIGAYDKFDVVEESELSDSPVIRYDLKDIKLIGVANPTQKNHAANKDYVDTQLLLKPNQEDIDFSDNITHIWNIVWAKEVEMAPLDIEFDFDSYSLVLCKTNGRILCDENILVYGEWLICYQLENDFYAIPHYNDLHKYNINKYIEYSNSGISVRNNKLFNFYGNIISFAKRPYCTSSGSPVEITYRNLLNIKINGCLIPGLQYLITDYIPWNFLGRYNIINFPRLNIIVTANDFSSFKSEAIAYTKSSRDYYNECTKFDIKFSFEDEFNYKFYMVPPPEAAMDAVYLGSGDFKGSHRHFYYWNHKVFSQDDMGPEAFTGVNYKLPYYLHNFKEYMFEYDTIKQYIPEFIELRPTAIHDVVINAITEVYSKVSSINYEYTGMIYHMSDSSGAVASYDYVCIKNGDVIPTIYPELMYLSLSGMLSPNQIYELLDYHIESFTTSDNVLIYQNPNVSVKLRIKAKDKTFLYEDVDYIIKDVNGEIKTFKAKYSLNPTSEYFASQPGVITWLKDDLENEAPFDFYQMLFDFTKKRFQPDYMNGNLFYGPQGWTNPIGGWLNSYLLPFNNGPWRDNTKNNKIKFNGNMLSFPIIISGDPIHGIPPLSNNDIEITHGPDVLGYNFIYLYPYKDLCNDNKIKFDRPYSFPENILFLTGSSNDLLNCLGQFSSSNSQIKESRIISRNRSCSLYNNDIKYSNITTSGNVRINMSSFKNCDCVCDVNPNLNVPERLIESCVFENGFPLNFYNVDIMHNVKSTGSFDFKEPVACIDGNLINGIFVPNHVLTSIPLIIYVPNEDLIPTDPEENILYLIGEEE